MYSKYERRTDTRTYEDRKKLYEGVLRILNTKIKVDSEWPGNFYLPKLVRP